MTDTNKHGLKRYIPSRVKREVRENSKFGCVLCRKGFYQYEHIDPTFQKAKEHDPENICCLCGSCHDAVTRGQISKAKIIEAYAEIQNTPIEDVAPPVGPLDFHDGSAELVIGGLNYSPAVRTVFRYHGADIIRVDPSENPSKPGSISAQFTDDKGDTSLRLNENEWVGSLENWDIEVEGSRLTVRRREGVIVLRLRLDPPGRIVVERLDMQYGDSHLLASEDTYAVGRYVRHSSPVWGHARIDIKRSTPNGVAIELVHPQELDFRDQVFSNSANSMMATEERSIVAANNLGVIFKSAGISIASMTGAFLISEFGIGENSLEKMRRSVFHDDDTGVLSSIIED